MGEHKNRKRDDNHYKNLGWETRSVNMKNRNKSKKRSKDQMIQYVPPKNWEKEEKYHHPVIKEVSACGNGVVLKNNSLLGYFFNHSGYWAVAFCIGKKKFQKMVHRLVWECVNNHELLKGECIDHDETPSSSHLLGPYSLL